MQLNVLLVIQLWTYWKVQMLLHVLLLVLPDTKMFLDNAQNMNKLFKLFQFLPICSLQPIIQLLKFNLQLQPTRLLCLQPYLLLPVLLLLQLFLTMLTLVVLEVLLLTFLVLLILLPKLQSLFNSTWHLFQALSLQVMLILDQLFLLSVTWN